MLSIFTLAFLPWLCTNQPTDEAITNECVAAKVAPNLDSVMQYLNGIDFKTDKDWHLFPLPNGVQDTLKRLGLPVHGRWVTTFVNQIAYDYIKANHKPDGSGKPLDFPCGSFIVKDNYRSAPDATTISADQSKLMVRTVLYKPDPSFDYCVTSHLADYNGADCYGGDWFYGFYFLDQQKKKFRMMTQKVQENIGAFCVNCHAPSYNTDYVRTLNSIRNPLSQPGKLAYCDFIIDQTNSDKSDSIPASIPTDLVALDTFCASTALSPHLPEDVPVNPAEIAKLPNGGPLAQLMFDCFAWKTFIALNWPNKLPKDGVPQRGEADTSLPFSQNMDQPTVWETYKPTFEVFQPGDVSWDPISQPWNQVMPYPDTPSCQPQAGELVLMMRSKARDVPNETGQAFAGSFGYLVDRNNKQVRYEVLFNRTEFEYIISESRAATKNLTPSGPEFGGILADVSFPDNRTDTKYNEGSIEIKSAWKSLCFSSTGDCKYPDAADIEAAKKKFLVRSLLVYDEQTGTCYRDVMALVGLHIIRKTHYAPQWVWMTFEHKDNVPPYGEENVDATFFDPSCVDSVECWNLPFLDNTPDRECCPDVDLNRFVNDWEDQPNQLTRLAPIEAQAAALNKQYQTLLAGTPFANYVLVSAQWPMNGRNAAEQVNTINCADNTQGDDCYTMKPRFLRNTVIESYMSTYCAKGANITQYSNRSCMSCHGSAGTDFSYVWLDAVSQRVPIKRK